MGPVAKVFGEAVKQALRLFTLSRPSPADLAKAAEAVRKVAELVLKAKP